MGIGDELMAMGEARRYVRERGCARVAIVDKDGRRRSHFLWEQSDYIAQPQQECEHSIVNGGNARPYIDYQRTTKIRWAFNLAYRPTPAELPWIGACSQAQGMILVEPFIKPGASPNKQWGRWQELVDAAPSLPWGQPLMPGATALRGVAPLPTRNFTEVCAMLRAARCAVLPEGALHHAAAAVGCPAVVLVGAYIPASVTGYDDHITIAVDDPEATGWRVFNHRCQQAWKTITPQRVLQAIKALA
jgi:ADP-heptose:LPS heptosyltransferase